MRTIFGGAALVWAGIAAFIEAQSHEPRYVAIGPLSPMHAQPAELVHQGFSTTALDLLRIGGSALVVFGGLLVIVGLIRLWGATVQGRGV